MEVLFVDTLNALSSQLQSSAIHILTHPRRSSEKIQALSMQLVQFKCGILSLLTSFLQQNRSRVVGTGCSSSRVCEEIYNQMGRNREKLSRYRLHQILKRKVQRKRRESMLDSEVQLEDQSISQLQKSVVLIEKDLGIQVQTDSLSQRLGLSSVISRSLLGEHSPTRTHANQDTSMMSLSCVDSSIQIQMQSTPKATSKQNMESNLRQTRIQQTPSIKQQVKPQQEVKKMGTAKKNKKTVFSKVDSSKEGLLGNLLEQTFNPCPDKK